MVVEHPTYVLLRQLLPSPSLFFETIAGHPAFSESMSYLHSAAHVTGFACQAVEATLALRPAQRISVCFSHDITVLNAQCDGFYLVMDDDEVEEKQHVSSM